MGEACFKVYRKSADKVGGGPQNLQKVRTGFMDGPLVKRQNMNGRGQLPLSVSECASNDDLLKK